MHIATILYQSYLNLTLLFAHLHIITILPQSYLSLTLLFPHLRKHFATIFPHLISVLLSSFVIFKCVLWQSYINLISVLLSSLVIFECHNLTLILSLSYFPFTHLWICVVAILPQPYLSLTLCIRASTYSDNLTSILCQSYYPLWLILT